MTVEEEDAELKKTRDRVRRHLRRANNLAVHYKTKLTELARARIAAERLSGGFSGSRTAPEAVPFRARFLNGSKHLGSGPAQR